MTTINLAPLAFLLVEECGDDCRSVLPKVGEVCPTLAVFSVAEEIAMMIANDV